MREAVFVSGTVGRTGQVVALGETMLGQVQPEGGTPGIRRTASDLAACDRSREGKPRELRGGEPTHPSGGSGLVVARHGRVEEGPVAAVAK